MDTILNGSSIRPENTYVTVRTMLQRQLQVRQHKPANDNGRLR